MDTIIKISWRSHLKHLKGIFFFLAFFTLFAFYQYSKGIQHSIDALIVVYAFMIGYSILVLYLHLEYYFTNKGVSLTIERDKIIYSKKGVDVEINFQDIKKIERFMTRRLYNGKHMILPTDFYHYTKITLSNDESYVITSLLFPDAKQKWPGNVERKLKIITFVD